MFDYKIDKNITDLKRISISAHKNIDTINLFGLDVEKMLKNEINISISKEIIKGLLDVKEIFLLDLIGFDYKNQIKKISDFVRNESKNYKNILVNNKISTYIKDSSTFHYTGSLDFDNDGQFTNIGYFHGLGLWTHSSLNWNYDIICFFDDIYINSKNDIKTENDKIIYSVDFDYYIKNKKVVYIRIDENSASYKEYMVKNRENKINNILNE